jgi:hypothetical protein
MAMALKGAGGLIVALGIFLWCGNMFRFFPTFPFAGYITIAIGAAIFGAGKKQAENPKALP